MKQGVFITFEGIDGCGKSTQAKRVYAYFKKRGYPALLLREPGGTPASERIRRILLDRRLDVSPLCELFLYEAARAQLAEREILPALRQGRVVLCDRYYDSTTAYQVGGRGLDKNLVNRLNRAASFGVPPDLTFIFDVDYATSLTRRGGSPDRLENETRAFFNRVRRGFKALASQRRVVMLDGRRDIDSLFEIVKTRSERLVRRRINGRTG